MHSENIEFNNSETPPIEDEARLNAIRKKISAAMDSMDMAAYLNSVAAKAADLRSAYPDWATYRLYHLLIGSTPSKNNPPTKFDFPKEDSVEAFLDTLSSSSAK